MAAQAIVWSGLAVLSWGAWAVFDKALLNRVPVMESFFSRYYLLFILMFPFLVSGWERNREAMSAGGREAAWVLVGSVLAMTGGTYFYYRALALDQASRVVPLTAAYPLVTVALSWFFFREPWTWHKIGGAVLVAAGSVLLMR